MMLRLTPAEDAALKRAAACAGISVTRLLVDSAMARVTQLAASPQIAVAIRRSGQVLNALVRSANAGTAHANDLKMAGVHLRAISDVIDADIAITASIVAALADVAALVRQWLRHHPGHAPALALMICIERVMARA